MRGSRIEHRWAACALAWAALGMAACGGPPGPLLPDCAGDPGYVYARPTHQMDLLLVLDNSNSMAEEQASLAAQLPRLFTALTRGELRDDAGDVVRVFQPMRRSVSSMATWARAAS